MTAPVQRWARCRSLACAAMATADLDALLVAVLALLDGDADALEAPALGALRADTPAFQRAGFASGLTAALFVAAERCGVAPPATWRAYGEDQRREVATRLQRFAPVLDTALGALAGADVPALPVKGAVLAEGRWAAAGLAGARPMSDLDLLVAPAQRERAIAALAGCGYRLVERSPWEDTVLAWGDGSVGRTDGESADHNGKIELHPGWVERLHHYLVDDGGLLLGELATPGELGGRACLRLDDAALALHVLGHLAATVIRAETRPMHVLDAVLCLEALDDDDRARLSALGRHIDARLLAPALWLVARYRPHAVPDGLLEGSMARLGPRARRRLEHSDRQAVLRDPSNRTTVAWREAFTTTAAERLAMARQALAPPGVDGRGGGTLGLAVQAERARRLLRVPGRR